MSNDVKLELPQYVSILGVEYSVHKKEIGQQDFDAATDTTSKEIILRSDNVNNVGNFEWLMKKQLRHEIIHAFLYESGLSFNSSYSSAWAVDEEIVDWMAIQMPKIVEVCTELGCM